MSFTVPTLGTMNQTQASPNLELTGKTLVEIKTFEQFSRIFGTQGERDKSGVCITKQLVFTPHDDHIMDVV